MSKTWVLMGLLLAASVKAQCPYGVTKDANHIQHCKPRPEITHWREVMRDGGGPWIVTYTNGQFVMVCNEGVRNEYRGQAMSTACVLLPTRLETAQ